MRKLYEYNETTARFPIRPDGSVGKYISISEEVEMYLKQALDGCEMIASIRKGEKEVDAKDLYFTLLPTAEGWPTNLEDGKHEFSNIYVEIGNYGRQPFITPKGRVSHCGGAELEHLIKIKFPNFQHSGIAVVWEVSSELYMNYEEGEIGHESVWHNINVSLRHW